MPGLSLNASFVLPSPLQLLRSKFLSDSGVKLWIKRDDLIHTQISGNKWRKLKYNIRQMQQEGKKGMITFGGAFSNHIYATAAAGQYFGFSTIGIIRGEASAALNPTLAFAHSCGMQLQFVSRMAYRDQLGLQSELDLPWEEYYLLPEGGSNGYALPGCAEMIDELKQQLDNQYPDYCCLSCGTGGTMAGLITGLKGAGQLIGFSALKGDFHQSAIADLLAQNQYPQYTNWQINTRYHFGGYARHNAQLIELMQCFYQDFQIPLDPIYTGKLFYGIFELIREGFFPKGSTVVALHSGGLQGNQGFTKRFGIHLPS
ncbi:MAG: pyridoxal-phosphate dependent enzyme [Bacteroidota bacterium]